MNAQTGDLKEGDEAPSFCLPDKDNREICFTDFKGKWIVLYFYPKDNTSGCTREAVEFTATINEFETLDTAVLGVSPDSVERHYKFAEKHNLEVTLLSDVEHKVLEAYGVWQQKKMYGREFWGVVRSTFLIDPEGKVAYVWRKVKVKGHVEAVKSRVLELQGKG
ncbi:peroxiredoxin Q/BCP [Candidatus Methanophagaceae archaeon]|nr:peroxiredoxin Q/BCP [Methanophagales archaeon]